MALQKQKIPLELTSGMDTKTDEFNSVSFKKVENFRYNKTGAMNKRPGYSQLSKSVIGVDSTRTDITSGVHLMASDTDLLLAATDQTYNYSSTAQKWLTKNDYGHDNNATLISLNSEIAACNYNINTELSNKQYVVDSHYGENSNYYVVAAINHDGRNSTTVSSYLSVKIVNKEEKSTVLEDIILVDTRTTSYIENSSIRVEVFPTYALVFYYSEIALAIKCIKYSFNAGSITNNGINPTYFLISGLAAGTYFDTCNDGTYTYLARINDATNSVSVHKIDVNLAVTTDTYVDAALTTIQGICINTITNGFRIAYFSSVVNTPIRHKTYTNALIVTHTQSTLRAAVSATYIRGLSFVSDGINTYFFYTISGDVSTILSVTFNVVPGTDISKLYGISLSNSSNAVVTAESLVINGALVQDKPVILNNSAIFGITRIYGQFSIKETQTYILLAVNTTSLKFSIAGKSNYLDYMPQFPYKGISCRTITKNGNILKVAIPKLKTAVASETFITANTIRKVLETDIVVCEFDFDYDALTYKTVDNNTYVSGSILKLYDGKSISELGFLDEPTLYGWGQITGTLSAGTYGLAAVSAWVDDNGNLHRSYPVFASITHAGAIGFRIFASSSWISQKQNMLLEIYLTAVNGTTYYLQQIVSKVEGATGKLFAANSDIKTNTEVLYTQSGELENDVPTVSSNITSHKNRLWALDKFGLQYSKIIEEGYPVEFSENLKIAMNDSGGEAVAIEGMDNVLVIFKKRSLYILSGEGPNNLGQQNDFGTPQKLPSDVGCVDARSVVSFPDGILFKSEKGIYILGRGLYVSYIGAPVEDYNSNTVLSSVLVSTKNEVRFLLDNGKILVYDYFHKFWMVDTATGIIDMAVLGSDAYMLKADGTVLKEVSSLFTDNAAFYSGTLETNWITVAGLNSAGALARSQQGFQRLYSIHLLGKYKSVHNLSVSIAYDYDDTIIDTALITTTAGTYQYEVRPSQQKCEAFKLIITDVSQAGTGESLVLSNVLLEVGIKGTAQKTTGDSSRKAAV